MKKEGRKLVDDLTLLLELYEDIYANVCNTYELLQHDAPQYALAISYLSLAHNSYMHAHVYIRTNGLHDNDFEEVLTAYKRMKHDIDEVIVQQNNDCRSLVMRYKEFEQAYLYSKKSLDSILQVKLP